MSVDAVEAFHQKNDPPKTKQTLNFHCLGVEITLLLITCHRECRNDFNAPDSLDAPHQQDAARHPDTSDEVFDQNFRCQILLPGPGSRDMRTGPLTFPGSRQSLHHKYSTGIRSASDPTFDPRW